MMTNMNKRMKLLLGNILVWLFILAAIVHHLNRFPSNNETSVEKKKKMKTTVDSKQMILKDNSSNNTTIAITTTNNGIMNNNYNNNNNRISKSSSISKIKKLSTKMRSREIEWLPVSQKERQPFIGKCNHPFQHCCIGQCHQIYYKIDPTNEGLFVKPNRIKKQTQIQNTATNNNNSNNNVFVPLENLSNLLRYMNKRNIRNIENYNNNTKRGRKRKISSNLHDDNTTTTTNIQNDHENDNDNDSSTCNLWFVGDSLAADHVISAMCQLTTLGYYTVESCSSTFGNPTAFGDDEMCNNIHFDDMYDINAYFKLQRKEEEEEEMSSTSSSSSSSSSHPTYCKTIILRFFLILIPSNEEDEYSSKPAKHVLQSIKDSYNEDPYSLGVIIWNWGVHCNKPGCITHYLNSTFEPFTREFYSMMTNTNNNTTTTTNTNNNNNNNNNIPKIPKMKWTLLWREHEPQHFNTDGGEWPAEFLKDKFHCRYHDWFYNSRNDEAWNFFDETNLLNKLPIIASFKAHQPLWYQHYNNTFLNVTTGWDQGDCTHYCYSPWRTDVTWDGIYYALKVLDDENNNNQ